MARGWLCGRRRNPSGMAGPGFPAAVRIDDDAVQRFAAITNASPEEAHFFLEANNGHMDRAVQMFYGPRAPPSPPASRLAASEASKRA